MYKKSILRGLIIDGGIAITDGVKIRDLLAEQADKSQLINTMGTWGGGCSIAFGLLALSLNPGALIAVGSGACAIYLGQRNKPTIEEEKEFWFLKRHGRIINLLGDFAKTGNATGDEIVSAYESLIHGYLRASDQIIVNGTPIAAGEMMAQLPKVIAEQRQSSEGNQSATLPAAQRKTMFPPSRLHEYAGDALPPMGQAIAPSLSPGQAGEGLSPVALLERTISQPAPIGLPSALAEVTVTKPYSTFIVGMSEAGKDIALYNIMAALKQRYPTALFVGIDGKNHAGESPLWSDQLYDRLLRVSMLDKVANYHPTLLKLLQDACNFSGMVFVAFSELNGIAGTYAATGAKQEWGEVTQYLRYLALQGNADGRFLMSTAQGVTLDELGITTATRSNIRFMMVGNATQFGFVVSVTAPPVTVFDRKLITDQNMFIAACSRSTALEHLPNRNIDKGIAYFHTALNRWEPMPRLLNPGVDRGIPVASPHPIEKAVTQAATTTEVNSAVPDVEPSIFDLECEVADACIEKIKKLNGRRITMSGLKRGLSAVRRSRWGDMTEELILAAEGIKFDETKTNSGLASISVWFESGD